MNNDKILSSLAFTGSAIGIGMIAGLAGTLAITASQMVEMKITKRSMSKAPAVVGGKVLGVEPKGLADVEREKARTGQVSAPESIQKKEEKHEKRFSQIMHFEYGTSWGVFRGLLDMLGIHGIKASLMHFGGIWGTALVMLPASKVSEPVTKWKPKEIAIDILHHAVYAFTAGLVYDSLAKANRYKQI